MATEMEHPEVWLPLETRYQLSRELIDLAIERIIKLPEFNQALARIYLSPSTGRPDNPRVSFDIRGSSFTVVHEPNHSRRSLTIIKNAFPTKEDDPAMEAITIEQILEVGHRKVIVHGIFQYNKAAFDPDHSRLHTNTPEAETAIRKFLDENFPA